MTNHPFRMKQLNHYTFITDEPRPECGFSRNVHSAWCLPSQIPSCMNKKADGNFRIIKNSIDDHGTVYSFCSECKRFICEGDGDIPPHTKSYCKQAHRIPGYSLPYGHPYSIKKSQHDLPFQPVSNVLSPTKFDVAKAWTKLQKSYDDIMSESNTSKSKSSDDDDEWEESTMEITTEYIVTARCKSGSTLSSSDNNSAYRSSSDWIPVSLTTFLPGRHALVRILQEARHRQKHEM